MLRQIPGAGIGRGRHGGRRPRTTNGATSPHHQKEHPITIESVLAVVRLVRRTAIVAVRHITSIVWSLVAATVAAIIAGVVVGCVVPAAGPSGFYCLFATMLETSWLAIAVTIAEEVKEGW